MNTRNAGKRCLLLRVVEKNSVLSGDSKYHPVRYVVKRWASFSQLEHERAAPNTNGISFGGGIISSRFAEMIPRESIGHVNFFFVFRFVIVRSFAQFKQTTRSEENESIG